MYTPWSLRTRKRKRFSRSTTESWFFKKYVLFVNNNTQLFIRLRWHIQFVVHILLFLSSQITNIDFNKISFTGIKCRQCLYCKKIYLCWPGDSATATLMFQTGSIRYCSDDVRWFLWLTSSRHAFITYRSSTRTTVGRISLTAISAADGCKS